jgi:hypothetical protein
MTPQERDMITTLLERLKDTARSGQPKDPEADGLIRQSMRDTPDAPYYLVQTVLIQDLSLHQAQNRIAELEQQLADASAQKSSGTSFLGGLFGGRESSSPPPAQSGPWSRGPQVAGPPPQAGGYPQQAPQGGYAQQGYPQQQQGYPQQGGGMMAGMMGGGMGGGGFLRSAAATAAGIAGGALLFQGISSLFGHGYANSLGASMTPGLGETVINNYYPDSGGGDYGGGDAGYSGGGDYGGGGGADTGYGGGDYGGGGDDYGGDGGGDFGGGDNSC